MDNEKIKQFITSQRQAGIPDAEIHAYLVQKGAIQMPKTEVAPKQDGFVKSIAKDVASTLLVKPAVRATEALTRTIAPNSLAAQGFKSMADSGQGQNIGGINIPQQEGFGQGGGRQIASDTLKTASYLFPYGKAATAIGGATGSKIAGNIASGAVGGYTADVGYNLEDPNKTIGESMIPGAGTAIGATIPLVGPAVRGAGRATAKLGSKAGELAIPVSSREAQILQTYKANNPFFKRVGDVLSGIEKAPTTAGKTAVKEGIIGTKSGIGVQAKRASDTLWKDVISPRLKESDQAVDLDGFFAKVEGDIIAKNPEISRQKALLEALEAYKEDYSGTKVVTLEQLQKFKEGWAKFVPEKAYKGKPIAGAFNDVRNELADEARTTIYSQLGDDVKQAYFDYGNLQGLKELGQVAMTGSKLKGGAGSFTSEILSRAVTPVATVGGQAIYRVGKGIEFIGNIGAKNLGEALGIKGGMKFPGDKAIDDIKKTFGQDANLPMSTQSSQIPTSVKSSSISPNSTTKTREIIPDSNLTGDDAIIQNKSIAKYKEDPKKLTDEYIKTQGKVVNTDEARKLFKDVGYRGSNAAAVQEASSAVAKDAWEQLLRTSKSNDALIFAGGSGTGKTSAVKNIFPQEIADAGVVLDGNLSSMKSATARIQESINAGKHPTIVYVYRDPADSWVNGVIKRMKEDTEEGGRVVPLTVFIENHKGSYDVIKNLLNDASNGVKYDIKMVDNSLGRGNQTLLKKAKFASIKYKDNLLEQLKKITKDLYDKGTITKTEYEALIK